MSSKALRYAEETLGVHQVWDEVQTRLADLDVALSELDKAQDRRRELEEKHADREVLLVLEKRGVHPSMSDTRFKSELKIWEREDDMLRQLRSELMEIRSEIQGREYDVDLFRLRIKAGSSRMEELGGYLHYLAAVKNQAEKTTKPTGQESE